MSKLEIDILGSENLNQLIRKSKKLLDYWQIGIFLEKYQGLYI